jgi:hypothetical protein
VREDFPLAERLVASEVVRCTELKSPKFAQVFTGLFVNVLQFQFRVLTQKYYNNNYNNKQMSFSFHLYEPINRFAIYITFLSTNSGINL